MTNTQKNIDAMLVRILDGSATTEDYICFKKWMEDEDNELYFKQIREIWHATAGSRVTTEELEQAVIKFRSHINKNSFSRRKQLSSWFAGCAAAVVLVVSACCFLYFQQEKIVIKNNEQEKLGLLGKISSAHIELRQSNGTRVNLSDSASQIKAEHNGIALNRSGERALVYTSMDSSKGCDLIYNELSVPAGERFTLTLADGTQVWLNGESLLLYPVSFTGTQREVTLVGQAYFKVAKDKAHPFIVTTGVMKVEVLGTSFEVSAYSVEEQSFMTLVEGAVKVSTKEQVLLIKPDEQVVVDETTGNITTRIVNAQELTLWKDGVLVIRNQTFVQMLRKLERWYGVKFVNLAKIPGEELFNGKFDRENVNVAMETISRSAGIDYKIKGTTIIISNGI